MRIVVLGYIVRGPLGGMAWHHLQYVLGLHRLGHDVHFLEDSDDYPSCYHPERYVCGTDPSFGLRFAADAFERLGLGERWAYHDAHTARWLGPAADRALDACRDADVLVNVSGVTPLREWHLRIPVRVLVDTDPVFTQIRHLADPAAHAAAARHTAFLSFGENIGTEGDGVPRDGFDWRPTRQPVVLDAWPVTPGPADAPFTTVMQWDSYPPREHAGRRYGMKSASFEPYVDLPRRTRARLEIALGSATAPVAMLRERGWHVRDPYEVTKDPWAYQQYIRDSKGEFTVAKHGYVASRSGWFSERSAVYLASGRPVVTQDTGFRRILEADAGLLAYGSPDEAVAAIEAVTRDYARHCEAAREVAAAYFDANVVLPRLLDAAAG
ncbi:MAG TPA: hypothetical protein VFZ93_11405 [Albitalea sp.]